ANSVCAPTGQARAFLKSSTNPLGQMALNTNNSCDGSVASTKNQNDINANRAGTTFAYDLYGRLTQTNLPDGGQTTNCYSDVGGSLCTQSGPPFQIVSSKSVGGSNPPIQSTVQYDGLPRAVQTQLNSDPEGPTFVDKKYDGLGQVSCVSNPYRSTTDSTY